MKNKFCFTDSVLLTGILAMTVLFRTWKYTPFPPSWDPAVYIQMGKYIFSNGHIGLIEPMRPLTWPLLLGTIFKLGFSPIIGGKILEYLFALGDIILIYRIGLKGFDKTTGLIAALFFSFSPTYFYYGNSLYSDIPGSFFGLLSVMFFIEENYLLSGILAGLTMNTRFIYFLAVMIMIGFSFFTSSKNGTTTKFYSPSVIFIKGILLSTIFFLFLNYFVYHHVFQPFVDARQIYGQVDFNWCHGMAVCIHRLFTIEGLVFIFIPLMTLAMIQSNVSCFQMMITAIGVGLFLWIGKLPTDIPHFLTACVPYLYLSSAYGFLAAYRASLSPAIKYFLLCLLACGLGWQICQIGRMYFPRNKLSIFQEYAIKHRAAIKDGLWVSDPTTTVFSDAKVQELMYYPVFNNQKIVELSNHLARSDYIFYDGSALVCRPIHDQTCAEAKKRLLQNIINNFELVFPDHISHFNNYGIFKRPSRFDPLLKEHS